MWQILERILRSVLVILANILRIIIEIGSSSPSETVDRWMSCMAIYMFSDEQLLLEAARAGDTNTAELLLSRGAGVNCTTTPSQWGMLLGREVCESAAYNRDFKTADLLIKLRPRLYSRGLPRARAVMGTPLHWSVHRGDFKLAALFVAKGANVSALDVNGRSPLHWLARKSLTDVAVTDVLELAALLISKGAVTNANDSEASTPLHETCLVDNLPMAKFLIASGADVHALNTDQHTPLAMAASNNAGNVAAVLMEAGAAGDARDKNLYTPLHLAAARNSWSVASLLIYNRADVEAKEQYERTPLHLAAAGNHVMTAQLLLGAGASVDARDETRCTPLHTAALLNHTQIAAFLLGKGAAIDALDDNNATPLHMAAWTNSDAVAALLICHGASLDAEDKSDGFPGVCCVQCGESPLVISIKALVGQENGIRVSTFAVLMEADADQKNLHIKLSADQYDLFQEHVALTRTAPCFRRQAAAARILMAEHKQVATITPPPASALPSLPKLNPTLAGVIERLGLAGLPSIWLHPDSVVVGPEALARGPAARVQLGQWQDAEVAIKVFRFPPNAGPSHPLVSVLRHELQVLIHTAGASSPHLCHSSGFTVHGRDAFIVRTIYKGTMSDHLLKQPGGKLTVMDTILYGSAIARGLQELHTLGVIHKDLRPEHVLFTNNGHLVLSEFGIASNISTHVNYMHRTHMEATVYYTAPEQLAGEADGSNVTFKADIWSLGCLLIHMLTGHPPLHDRTLPQIVRTVATKRKAHEIPTGLHPLLEVLIRCCISFDPSERPSAMEVVVSLRDICSSICESTSIAFDEDKCVVCMDKQRTTAFMHGDSAHLCVCRECAKTVMALRTPICPMCRLLIKGTAHVYS